MGHHGPHLHLPRSAVLLSRDLDDEASVSFDLVGEVHRRGKHRCDDIQRPDLDPLHFYLLLAQKAPLPEDLGRLSEVVVDAYVERGVSERLDTQGHEVSLVVVCLIDWQRAKGRRELIDLSRAHGRYELDLAVPEDRSGHAGLVEKVDRRPQGEEIEPLHAPSVTVEDVRFVGPVKLASGVHGEDIRHARLLAHSDEGGDAGIPAEFGILVELRARAVEGHPEVDVVSVDLGRRLHDDPVQAPGHRSYDDVAFLQEG